MNRRAESVKVSLPDPVFHFDEKEKADVDFLVKQWQGVDLIVLGSSEINPATGMALQKVFKEEKRVLLKERDNDFMKELCLPSKETFSGNPVDLHNACSHKDKCSKKDFNEVNIHLRSISGIKFQSSSQKESIYGLCNWLDSKAYEEKFPCLSHLVVADNPFCLDSCPCHLKAENRHKIIIIQGLNGPSTYDTVRFLCGKIALEQTLAWEEIKKSVAIPNGFIELLLQTRTYAKRPSKPHWDQRIAPGVIDEVIDVSSICENKIIFSYRSQWGDSIQIPEVI